MKGFTAGLTAIAAAVAACGGSSNPGTNTDRQPLQLVIDEKPMGLTTGESIVIQLLVIGQDASDATISSPDLPPFATLAGSRLTLAPGRAFQGDYSLTLIAKAGSSSASATLHVTVVRDNSAPVVGAAGFTWGDNTANLYPMYCIPHELHGTASLYAFVGDADGDSVTWDAEVVPEGQPFSGRPTHSLTAPVGVDHAERCGGAYDRFHACFQLRFDGLAPGSYSVAMRVRDALGAPATRLPGGLGRPEQQENGDGWWTSPNCYAFTLVP